MTLKTIISETEHVIAIEQDLGGDVVVVTFNSLWQYRNGLRFFGDNCLLKLGISAVGIVTTGPNWYPSRAMDQLLVAVQERTKGKKVVTYGHSQGGYGALKFAARLRASVTLSFSPQWSINPADVSSFDKRFTRHFDEALRNGLRIEQDDLCDRSFVFFDRTEKGDAENAAQLASSCRVTTVVTPFSMDETIRLIAQPSGVARLINLYTSEAPPSATDFRRVIRASRRHSDIYLDSMLRQLILRMSRSRRRSSAFVSGLLANTEFSNPFHSALIAHAMGNVSLAHSELAKTTARGLDNVDLMPWWRLSHELRYVAAELALAAEILARHPTNIVACLQAVSTLINVGKLEDAHDVLTRLTKHADAVKHIDRFVEYSLKLRKSDVIENILSDALPRPAQISVLFRLVGVYRRLGNRPNAFRKLMDLVQICADSTGDLKKVASGLVELGEFSYALDLRISLLRRAPSDLLLALDVLDVKARSSVNRNKRSDRSELKSIHSELKEIMNAPDLPSAAWEHASHLYDFLRDEEAALRAISVAVTLPKPAAGARYRLASLLARSGLTQRASDELVTLLAEGRADANVLRASSDLASRLGNRQLAQRFAEAQYQGAPTDPVAILHLAHSLRVGGEQTPARSLLSSLFHVERASSSISDRQWVQLAEELYNVGDIALAKEAVTEALARAPKDEVIRKLAATISVAEKFYMR